MEPLQHDRSDGELDQVMRAQLPDDAELDLAAAGLTAGRGSGRQQVTGRGGSRRRARGRGQVMRL